MVPQSTFESMQRQMEAMAETIQKLQRQQSQMQIEREMDVDGGLPPGAGGPGVAAAAMGAQLADHRTLSTHEKQKLADDIQNLPHEKMLRVVEIIQEHAAFDGAGDDCEIDIGIPHVDAALAAAVRQQEALPASRQPKKDKARGGGGGAAAGGGGTARRRRRTSTRSTRRGGRARRGPEPSAKRARPTASATSWAAPSRCSATAGPTRGRRPVRVRESDLKEPTPFKLCAAPPLPFPFTPDPHAPVPHQTPQCPTPRSRRATKRKTHIQRHTRTHAHTHKKNREGPAKSQARQVKREGLPKNTAAVPGRVHCAIVNVRAGCRPRVGAAGSRERQPTAGGGPRRRRIDGRPTPLIGAARRERGVRP